MKNIRARNIIQLIVNILMAGCSIWGLLTAINKHGGFSGFNWNYFYLHVGLLTGIIITICSIIGIVFNIVRIVKNNNTSCGFVYALNLMTAVLSVASIAFVAVIVSPRFAGTSTISLLKRIGFYFVIPGAFILSFLFFETSKVRNIAYMLVAPIITVAYGATMMALQSTNHFTEIFDGFFNVNRFLPNQWYFILLMVVVIVLGAFGVGVAFLFINRAMSKRCEVKKADPSEVEVYVIPEGQTGEPKEEPVDESTIEAAPTIQPEPEIVEEKPAAEQKKASEKRTVKTTVKSIAKKVSTTVKKVAKKENGDSRVYHISKRWDTKMWQVKMANGKKAIKFFNTQAEAVEYAKQLTDTQGGSIRVHSLKGKIKKTK